MVRRIHTPSRVRYQRIEARLHRLVWQAVVFSCVAVAPLSGQRTDQPELLQAIEAYDAGELQRALILLQSAPPLLSTHDAAVRSLYTGLIQFALGESTAARLAFVRAVRLEPPIRLDPAVHSPARVAAFEAAKATVVEELKVAARETDGGGDVTGALEQWRVVRLAVPDDEEANRRIVELEAEEERQRQEAAAIAAATPDTIVAPPSATPVAEENDPPATVIRRLNPGQALVMGLIVPGLGEFYTGKSMRGVIALGAAGGVLATGLLSERLEIDCASVPVNDVCPPADILDERTRRPYLAPAVAAAAGIALIGAIDAMITARRSNARALAATNTDDDASSPRLLAPSFSASRGILRFDVVRIRFR